MICSYVGICEKNPPSQNSSWFLGAALVCLNSLRRAARTMQETASEANQESVKL